MPVINEIDSRIKQLKNSFNMISDERKDLLKQFAEYISNKVKDGKEVNLTFICTHNSRRSQISQIWAQTAAHYFDVPNVNCYSGGTETTAFNQSAVKALQKTGFEIQKESDSENPFYLVRYSEKSEPIKCFSKKYSDSFNSQTNFAAIMTCSDADTNCPIVIGAEKRFPIRFKDPKEYDGTDLEEEKYLSSVLKIGLEMIYLFDSVNKKL